MTETRDRAPVEHFERLARESPDPWGYATRSYEQAKYRLTLEQLPGRIETALELGCSVGVFTAKLAPRCERLLALDFSPTALRCAEDRVAGLPQVELRQARLPEQMPTGPFEAIVCSELLYYWESRLVREGLARIEAALAPGGVLVAVHWRHGDPRRPLDGNEVHRILAAETALRHRNRETHEDFLLDCWVRAAENDE